MKTGLIAKVGLVATYLVIILICIILQLNIAINPDSAWHLYVADQILAGKKLYVDIIEVNFPFIYYFRTIPHFIAGYTGISYITASMWLNIFITLSGFLISIKLLRYTEYSNSPAIKTGMCIGMFLMPFAMTQNFFGEKEHLILVMMAPYIISAIADGRYYATPPYKRIGIAVFAALGIGIKPPYALVFIAVEIYTMLRHRKRLVEPLTIITIGILYIAFILTVTPQFMAISTLTKTFYSSNQWYYFFIMPLRTIHSLFFLLVILTWPSCKQYPVQRYFLVIFITCLAVASTHLKSYDYYYYPAMFFATILFATPIGKFLAALIVALSGPDKINKIRTIDYYNFTITLFVVPYITLSIIFGMKNLAGNYVLNEYSGFSVLKQYLEGHGTKLKIAVFGNLPDAFPLVNYTNSQYSLRYSGIWLPCGLARYREQHPETTLKTEKFIRTVEEFYINGIIEDFEQNRPDIVIINVPESKGCIPIQDFAGKYPGFANIWRSYRLADTITPDSQNSIIYQIYTNQSK